MIRACQSAALLCVSLGVVLASWVCASAAFFPVCSLDFDAGRRIFRQRCASCHAIDSRHGQSLGPSLHRIGAVAASRIPGMSAERYLVESILTPQANRAVDFGGVMPADIAKGLSPNELMNLVGYLMAHGGQTDVRRLKSETKQLAAVATFEQPPVRVSEAEAGRELFVGKAKCIQCHSLRSTAGFDLLAPNLLSAGHHTAAYLRESICQQSRIITSGYEVSTVYLKSGTVASGRLLRRDAETVTLLALEAGTVQFRRIPVSEIEVDEDAKPLVDTRRQSAMPGGYDRLLSEAEIDLLVTFLETLK